MSIEIDPEGHETQALAKAATWRGRRVLEIGCGEGRLTLRLARLGARVEAIDPEAQLLRAARRVVPARLADRIRFRVGSAYPLARRSRSFDRVVFSWSL
jgi:ubiquinone/menaquinone biosynthesis C-methylase UbiE